MCNSIVLRMPLGCRFLLGSLVLSLSLSPRHTKPLRCPCHSYRAEPRRGGGEKENKLQENLILRSHRMCVGFHKGRELAPIVHAKWHRQIFIFVGPFCTESARDAILAVCRRRRNGFLFPALPPCSPREVFSLKFRRVLYFIDFPSFMRSS